MQNVPVPYGQYMIAENRNDGNGPVLLASGDRGSFYEIISFTVTRANAESYPFFFAINTREAFVTDFVTGDTGQRMVVEQAIETIIHRINTEKLVVGQEYYYELSLEGFIPVSDPSWLSYSRVS